MSPMIIGNIRNMYIGAVNSQKSLTMKEIYLWECLVEFMEQMLESSRKYLCSSLYNSRNRYHFRIIIIKLHKLFAECLATHPENEFHCFWKWKLTLTNKVSLRICNKSRAVFLHVPNKEIKLVFDDITVFPHDKVLQLDVYIWLASPHIFGFLSIPICKNLHYIHKKDVRVFVSYIFFLA